MKRLTALMGIVLFTLLLTSTVWGQLNGTYYIGNTGTRPGGGDPDYPNLKTACMALNTTGISGNVTMYFTSDITEPGLVHLGVNTGANSITFKPHSSLTSCKITFSRATNPAGTAVFGIWVIGNTDTTFQVPVRTDNIIIDGSVTPGGTTRDLTLECTGAGSGLYPLRINGDCNNFTLQNCILNTTVASGGTYGVRVTSFRNTAAAIDSVPDNVLIENNQITATGSTTGNPIGFDGAAGMLIYPTGVVVRNNKIVGRHRGIFLNYIAGINIYGNEIRMNQTGTGFLSYGIQPNIIGTGGTINVFNNTLTQISTSNTTLGTYGMIGIYAGVAGTWNVYNNTVAGFSSASSADPSLARLWGIQVASVTANVFHNTIYMVNLPYTVSANNTLQLYTGIYLSSGTVAIKNNIIVSAETGDTSYAIYNAGATLTSDYNNLYVPGSGSNGFLVYASATRYATLAAWQGSSGSPDAHSANVVVTFTSTTDLHLSGGSNGDLNLTGVAGLGIATDIDGQTRDANFPYMGADEAAIALPVELVSFTASARGKSVELSWATATEVNNYGFDIERKAVNKEWAKVGFVEGKGTTNAPQNYSFRENLASTGKYTYRLKQIDRDGKFTYSKEVEAVVGLTPADYTLNQNYPNPFNPSTTIRFAIKMAGHVTLRVYNTVGQEVRSLFEEMAEADRMYSVVFDGTGLASGTYFYVLQTPASREVKKMLMLK